MCHLRAREAVEKKGSCLLLLFAYLSGLDFYFISFRHLVSLFGFNFHVTSFPCSARVSSVPACFFSFPWSLLLLFSFRHLVLISTFSCFLVQLQFLRFLHISSRFFGFDFYFSSFGSLFPCLVSFHVTSFPSSPSVSSLLQSASVSGFPPPPSLSLWRQLLHTSRRCSCRSQNPYPDS